ncbi:MAG: hypothetical protein KAT79_02400 [candidate division Zixibacteria bacterium]|nr:hypothetical protein [candidate division Zixibacteria bacterium]
MTSSFWKQGIKQASIIIGAVTITSQLFGLIREAVIANYFGTSAEYDILLVALAVPLMVASILFAAIPSASIPHLQQTSATGTRNIFRSTLFNISTLLIFGVTIAVYLAMPLLGDLLAQGMDEEGVNAVVRFGRLFCLLIPLRSYESLFRSFCHVKHHFVFPTVAAVGFNIAIIIILLTSFPSLGSLSFILAWVVGMFVQMLIVGVPAYLIHKRAAVAKAVSSFPTGSFLRFLGVIVIIESIGLTLDSFDRYMGGIFLEPGYVSATYYANIVYFIPLRIVIYSLATAMFPTFSEQAVENDRRGLATLYHRAGALCVLLIIPAAVFLYLFRNEIIWLLFERGRFVIESRLMTVEFLSYLLIGLFFNSIFLLQVRVFYALKSWRFFIIVRATSMGLKVAIGLLLINSNWALALAGGTVALFVLAFFALEGYLIIAKKLVYSTDDRKLLARAALIAVSTVAVMTGGDYLLTQFVDMHRLVTGAVVGITGLSLLVMLDQKLCVSGINLKK